MFNFSIVFVFLDTNHGLRCLAACALRRLGFKLLFAVRFDFGLRTFLPEKTEGQREDDNLQ